MIRETIDMELVNHVLTHPDIWKDIAPDVPAFDAPYLPYCHYFLVGDCAGVVIFHEFRDSIKIHPNILPAYRGKQAYRWVEESIQAMFDRGYPSIYAEIPYKLRHVIRFAKALKFNHLEDGDKLLLIRRKLDS